MITVAIIDYGMGNLHSVGKAMEHVAPDARVLVTSDAGQIRQADKVILPGVGAMRDCMAEIRRLGFDQLVLEVAHTRPLLGICVGMQALMQRSEENGGVDAIGLFPGSVRFFGNELQEASPTGELLRLKVPHMGWNQVHQTIDHPMWHQIADEERFYFVHSYYLAVQEINACAGAQARVAGMTRYGVDVAAAIAGPSVFAVQFHPEKSHRAGLQLLKNFASWSGD